MKVYSYKMRTDQWELCPQDFYSGKIVISKEDTTKRFEKNAKLLWEYFHEKLDKCKNNAICETFYINNIETPIIYGSNLTSEQLNKLYKEHQEKQNKEKGFNCDITTGDELLKDINKYKKYRPRKLVKDIVRYCKDENEFKKVLTLYGLRTTGKTVLMYHAMTQLDYTKCAFIYCDKTNTVKELLEDLKKLKELGYIYIFIDEITYIKDFKLAASTLSDVFVKKGMKIVIAGTDSYILNIVENDELYRRSIRLSTTFIDYQEYKYLYPQADFDYYVKRGGVLDVDELYVNSHKYIEDSIVVNIINSFNKLKINEPLYSLENKDILIKAVLQILQETNNEITANKLPELFTQKELGSILDKVKQVKDKEGNLLYLDIDKKLNIDNINSVFCYYFNFISSKKSSLTDEQLKGLKDKLREIHVLTNYYKLQGTKQIFVDLITQPGLRYQMYATLKEALLSDDTFNELDASLRQIVLTKLEQEVYGEQLEHELVKKCLYLNKNYNLNLDIKQVRYTNGGEWDLLIKKDKFFDIYEIKHDSYIDNPKYVRWLKNKEMCEFYKTYLDSEIRNKYLLSNFNEDIIKNEEDDNDKNYKSTIICKNINKFLIDLNQNNIF